MLSSLETSTRTGTLYIIREESLVDIEGRSLLVDDSKVNHKAIKRELKQALQSSSDASVDKLKLKRGKNTISQLNCVTLTNVDIDREVLEAIQAKLEHATGQAFYLVTNGAQQLHARNS